MWKLLGDLRPLLGPVAATLVPPPAGLSGAYQSSAHKAERCEDRGRGVQQRVGEAGGLSLGPGPPLVCVTAEGQWRRSRDLLEIRTPLRPGHWLRGLYKSHPK